MLVCGHADRVGSCRQHSRRNPDLKCVQSNPKPFDERRITIATVAIQDPNPIMRVDAEVERSASASACESPVSDGP